MESLALGAPPVDVPLPMPNKLTLAVVNPTIMEVVVFHVHHYLELTGKISC